MSPLIRVRSITSKVTSRAGYSKIGYLGLEVEAKLKGSGLRIVYNY